MSQHKGSVKYRKRMNSLTDNMPLMVEWSSQPEWWIFHSIMANGADGVACRGGGRADREQHQGPRLHSIPFIQAFMKRKSCAEVLDRSRLVLRFQSQGLNSGEGEARQFKSACFKRHKDMMCSQTRWSLKFLNQYFFILTMDQLWLCVLWKLSVMNSGNYQSTGCRYTGPFSPF